MVDLNKFVLTTEAHILVAEILMNTTHTLLKMSRHYEAYRRVEGTKYA